MRARGLGANVIVTEINPIKALEAHMDGFTVLPMNGAAKKADFICTLTGNVDVVNKDTLSSLKDGCIIANSGHFNNEIDIKALAALSKSKREIRHSVEEYSLKNGNRIYLLGEGRLINLAAAEGHPASVMDMSFANQALGAEYMLKHVKSLSKDVHVIPKEVDQNIATIKLQALGVSIDTLTPKQKKYLGSWEEGTA